MTVGTSTDASTEREQMIRDLVLVMASDEWTDTDMKTIALHIRQEGAAAFIFPPNLAQLGEDSVQSAFTKWHCALDKLRAPPSTKLSAPMRHQTYLSSWKARLLADSGCSGAGL